MIGTAAPAFLVAGAVFATVPMALHFLTRRPPAREPLPTARFLSPDARTLLRFRNRPADVPLLVVRVLFALTLGSAFAGLTWTGQRSGDVRVILLDAGADSLRDWPATLEEVGRLTMAQSAGVGSGPTVADPTGTGRTEAVILAYGLDTEFRVVNAADLPRLTAGSEPATARDGLHALRATASESRWSTAHATWVTRPSWQVWSRGIGLLRPSLWPGGMTLVESPARVAEPVTPTQARATQIGATPGAPAPGTTAWVHPGAVGSPLQRALEALGATVITDGDEARATPEWIFADAPTGPALDALLDRAREGATVVLAGVSAMELANERAEIPWRTGETGGTDGGVGRPDGSGSAGLPAARAGPAAMGVVLPSGLAVGSVLGTSRGTPTSGSRVIAVLEDATPAASASVVGRGCVVYAAVAPLDPGLTGSPDYPALVDALAHGCTTVASAEGPLDSGARFALERPDLPTTVEAANLGGSGYPLTRWLLGLALTLFAFELALIRMRRASVGEEGA